MPRLTISVIAPGHALDQDIITLELPPGLSVSDLKNQVHAETGFPQADQHFSHNNSPLRSDEQTLEAAGVVDGEMIALFIRSATDDQPRQRQRQQQQTVSDNRTPSNPQEIESTRLGLILNPEAMAQIREQRPALADAMHDSTRFYNVWMEMLREDQVRKQERAEQMRRLNEDPFDIDAQKRIEEMIRQESVQKNLQFAYEHNPEVFGRVTMLYINVLVNKNPLKAFVDSGAQTTIMSPSCAEACGILRLIDRRYSGVAKGVGTAQILGRVHSAEIQIGRDIMSCSFTVMEGKDVDLLLGLDMLRRFQAVIDLRRNKLVFGEGNEVDFLGEADIPKDKEEAMQSEPTVAGPNGTEIGTQSGTVKPAGTSAAAASASSSSAGASGASQGAGPSLANPTRGQAPPANEPHIVSTPAGPGTAPPRSKHPKEAVDRLQSLGFSRQQAVAALDACDGDLEYAAGLLFQR